MELGINERVNRDVVFFVLLQLFCFLLCVVTCSFSDDCVM